MIWVQYDTRDYLKKSTSRPHYCFYGYKWPRDPDRCSGVQTHQLIYYALSPRPMHPTMPPTYNASYNGSYMYVYQDCTATYISATSHSRKQHNLYVIFFWIPHYIVAVIWIPSWGILHYINAKWCTPLFYLEYHRLVHFCILRLIWSSVHRSLYSTLYNDTHLTSHYIDAMIHLFTFVPYTQCEARCTQTDDDAFLPVCSHAFIFSSTPPMMLVMMVIMIYF